MENKPLTGIHTLSTSNNQPLALKIKPETGLEHFSIFEARTITTMENMSINRIKQIITEHKSTGKALAEYLHYHPNSISQWSVNSAQPSLHDLYKVARFFNINVHNLIIPYEPNNEVSPCEMAKRKAQETKMKALKKKLAKKQKNKAKKQK